MGKRFVCDYIGGGDVGELAASLIASATLDRWEAWARRRAARAREEELLEDLQRFVRIVDLLGRATLLVAGYHRHDRGAWRRRRHGREEQA